MASGVTGSDGATAPKDAHCLPDGARWLEDSTSGGVRERRFDLLAGGRTVPGLLWTPDGADGPRPLVLIGHGAAGDKREHYVLALARRIVRHRAFAAAAIDGPVHGHRRGDAAAELAFLDFSARWSADRQLTDSMVKDWRATLDFLVAQPDVGPGPVGYWGLSMGTILGLPLVAAEPRIVVAVLGLMGLTGPTRERIDRDAVKLRCPVLFLLQWDDELFSRGKGFELFDRLGSNDKRLHAYPGRHGEVSDEAFAASEGFIANRLDGSVPRVAAG